MWPSSFLQGASIGFEQNLVPMSLTYKKISLFLKNNLSRLGEIFFQVKTLLNMDVTPFFFYH